jgi:Holliday junction DNA helicase RuvA
MLDFVTGTIVAVNEKSVVVQVGGIGLTISTPNARSFAPESSATLHTYLHWNAENGPSLFGFATTFDRTVFLMIIDCPKVGPGIGLSVLSQLSASQFLEIVTTSNQEALSKVNGIGAKKAEQIIVELKHKVQKLLQSGALKIEQQESFVQWQQLSEVLASLNYTKQEVTKATTYLSEKYTGQNLALDQLIRASLAYLSQKQG